MTIGDLYSLNSYANFDYIEIWKYGRTILEETRMDSMHLAWYDWQIKSFFCFSKQDDSIKFVVNV